MRKLCTPLFVTAVLLALVAGSSGQYPVASSAAPDSMFMQTAAEVLNHEFNDPDLSYLAFDAKSARLLASHWAEPNQPIPMGSLVKPFTALAYGEEHGFQYPTHFCRGAATGCWRPRGHGKMTLTAAIAQSCNSYFRVLASTVRTASIETTAASFGIEAPGHSAANANLIGLGDRWRVSPTRMARAYLELAARRDQPGVRDIIEGMALSAREGTGTAVGRALPHETALVKTGTAPCTHARRAPGDGFVIAIWPATNPRILLLVRVHGKPGAEAAVTAGEMLRRISQ